jgi:hypothetical protein
MQAQIESGKKELEKQITWKGEETGRDGDTGRKGRKELTRKRSSKVGHGVGRRRRLLFVFAHGDGKGP